MKRKQLKYLAIKTAETKKTKSMSLKPTTKCFCKDINFSFRTNKIKALK